MSLTNTGKLPCNSVKISERQFVIAKNGMIYSTKNHVRDSRVELKNIITGKWTVEQKDKLLPYFIQEGCVVLMKDGFKYSFDEILYARVRNDYLVQFTHSINEKYLFLTFEDVEEWFISFKL